MDQQKNVELRAYSHKELARLYKVSWVTFQEWLKPLADELGKKQGHFFNIRQVKIIFEQFGWPVS